GARAAALGNARRRRARIGALLGERRDYETSQQRGRRPVTLRLGSLLPAHRPQLENIVRATGVFNDAEVTVALELFDTAVDYEFIGAFDGDALVGYACFGATP